MCQLYNDKEILFFFHSFKLKSDIYFCLFWVFFFGVYNRQAPLMGDVLVHCSIYTFYDNIYKMKIHRPHG